MARHVKIRPSYMNDSRFLLRLIEAVEMDPKRPVPWKVQVIDHLKGAVTLLQETIGANLVEQPR